ncbi:MAG TPA: hypothetical protein VFV38_00710 [Ktedonobacteraceae bacterium]|nr:hypothetical protein [Ktedonobacteraceae bacterium]
MERAYHFVSRLGEVEHRHPYLVFDRQDHLHFHLTVFAKEVSAQLSKGTARTYLYAILPWFTFLDTDLWQQRTYHSWEAPPLEIRQMVDNYLIQYLQCKVRQHHQGFQLVSITQGTQSTVSIFLSGLKFFYRVMKRLGYYSYANPLVDPASAFHREMEVEESRGDQLNEYPRMPEISGVTSPQRKARLSDSYFKLEGEVWIPQIVDDPTLPAQILAGGRKIHWNLREECVTRLLFESGGRISEVVGLTLGDWMARGMLQEANTFSKGSHGVRIKFLRFSNDTAKLLRRYFDDERRKYDPDNHTLAEYTQLANLHQINANAIPLFLSRQKTPLSEKTFRENFWNPACQIAGIDVDIHQARQWIVNSFVIKSH